MWPSSLHGWNQSYHGRMLCDVHQLHRAGRENGWLLSLAHFHLPCVLGLVLYRPGQEQSVPVSCHWTFTHFKCLCKSASLSSATFDQLPFWLLSKFFMFYACCGHLGSNTFLTDRDEVTSSLLNYSSCGFCFQPFHCIMWLVRWWQLLVPSHLHHCLKLGSSHLGITWFLDLHLLSCISPTAMVFHRQATKYCYRKCDHSGIIPMYWIFFIHVIF